MVSPEFPVATGEALLLAPVGKKRAQKNFYRIVGVSGIADSDPERRFQFPPTESLLVKPVLKESESFSIQEQPLSYRPATIGKRRGDRKMDQAQGLAVFAFTTMVPAHTGSLTACPSSPVLTTVSMRLST